MARLLVLTLVITLGFLASADAQIELKNNIITGWKYSLDGVDFKGVGFSGKSLCDAMDGNEAAQFELRQYRDDMIRSLWFTIPGIILGAISLKEDFDGDEVETPLGWRFAIIGLLGTSLAYEHSANQHLKRSIQIYNGDILGFDLNYSRPPTGRNGNLQFSLSVGF